MIAKIRIKLLEVKLLHLLQASLFLMIIFITAKLGAHSRAKEESLENPLMRFLRFLILWLIEQVLLMINFHIPKVFSFRKMSLRNIKHHFGRNLLTHNMKHIYNIFVMKRYIINFLFT